MNNNYKQSYFCNNVYVFIVLYYANIVFIGISNPQSSEKYVITYVIQTSLLIILMYNIVTDLNIIVN